MTEVFMERASVAAVMYGMSVFMQSTIAATRGVVCKEGVNERLNRSAGVILLLQEAARFQGGFQCVAIFWGHRDERQAVLFLAETEHGEGRFHRDGV